MISFRHIAAAAVAGVLVVTTPSLASDCPTIDEAVESPGRPEADRARDEGRKPADVLCFFGLKSGDHVFDLFSGGGYYTEIVADAVGKDGAVVAHNNSAYVNYAKDELAERYANDRLPNAKQMLAEAGDLALEKDHFDMILMVLAFHDLYYVSEDNETWPSIDAPGVLKALYEGLKPGGVVGVVDHVGVAMNPRGTDEELRAVVNSLHRIDPAIIKEDMTAAGFVFEAESDLLRNPDDDLTQPMWAEGIRGKTDRVVYRFRKPAN